MALGGKEGGGTGRKGRGGIGGKRRGGTGGKRRKGGTGGRWVYNLYKVLRRTTFLVLAAELRLPLVDGLHLHVQAAVPHAGSRVPGEQLLVEQLLVEWDVVCARSFLRGAACGGRECEFFRRWGSG